MPSLDQVIAQRVPESLGRFMRESCGVAVETFQPLPAEALPEPARSLLAHPNDMTSTLAAFHGSPLRVEILKKTTLDDLYLREVFLRTIDRDRVVEYGVIAIALDRFRPVERQEILAGKTPLGGLLHRFRIPFVSAPISYLSASAPSLSGSPLELPDGATCYGRFNRLSTPTAEPIAWILEILPHAPA